MVMLYFCNFVSELRDACLRRTQSFLLFQRQARETHQIPWRLVLNFIMDAIDLQISCLFLVFIFLNVSFYICVGILEVSSSEILK